jgi:hypothetical protein
MSTGDFSDWSGNMVDLGPLYPFVGSEGTMVILAVIFWIGWHIVQVRMESRAHEAEARRLREGDNLQKALQSEHTIERM